ncbi:hypothetical protein D9M68_620670 [compost metagenome]
MKPKLLLALTGMLVLTGCHEGKPPAPSEAVVKREWLSTPALPIIQDAVFTLSPTFRGERNPAMMQQVCGLARGELKQEQVNAFLAQQKIDTSRLAKGSILSLLVNGDKAAQATACAAYLATTVLSTVDASEFMTATAAPSADDKTTEKPTTWQIDNARLNVSLPIKLAEARANAEVFALIAAELQRRPGLTVQAYRDEARQLFSRLAPAYLERIKQSLPPAGTTYKLVRLDGDGFVFNSSRGSRFEYTSDGLRLWQNGILWYGEGKLLGQEYPLQVTYFTEAVNELLAPGKK